MSSWGITPIYPSVRLLFGTTIPSPSTRYNCTALFYIWYNYTVPFHVVQLYGIVLHMTVLWYPTTVPAFCLVQLYRTLPYGTIVIIQLYLPLIICYCVIVRPCLPVLLTTVPACVIVYRTYLCYPLSYLCVIYVLFRNRESDSFFDTNPKRLFINNLGFSLGFVLVLQLVPG